ncbi:MAG: DNA-processing protein DprA, partial [Gammaproteobacteria bacterium]|nr:DNA-processing protein DprA [Gammaproteobacteria bacterium]
MAGTLSISTDTLSDWLTLYHAPGVGAVTLHRLLERFPNPGDLQQLDSEQLRQLGLKQASIKALQRPDKAAIEQDLNWHEKPGNRIMCYCDPDYPALLQQIPAPPPILYIHGNAALLGEPQLAMVGSRNPTASGPQPATE